MESADHASKSGVLAICIATCGRPRGLAALLDSLASQELPQPSPRIMVLIVDNAPAHTGLPTVDAASLNPDLDIRLVQESRAGIPFARNRCLDLAAECDLGPQDLLVFVDDDEVLPPTWLAALLVAQGQSAADIVTGPVRSRFEADADQELIGGGFFDLQGHEDGATLACAYTNNTLLRFGVLAETNVRFDERMAERGGSDALFFRQLVQRGQRIHWAQDAFLWEDVPNSRVSTEWILRRAFRLGANRAFIERALQPGVAVNLKLVCWAISRLSKGLLSLLLLFWRGRVTRLWARRHLAYGSGHLAGLFGFQYREYRQIHGS